MFWGGLWMGVYPICGGSILEMRAYYVGLGVPPPLCWGLLDVCTLWGMWYVWGLSPPYFNELV